MADEVTPPLSGMPTGPLTEETIKNAIYQRAQSQYEAQKAQMGMYDQMAAKYGQSGMSDIDKASILFQAAGALSAPTRSGGLMESIGAAGTAVAGPLSKAAQAQREREDKMSQLQMARAKLSAEMSPGPSPSDLMSLYKLQQAGEEKPALQERLIDRLGTEKDPQKRAAIRLQLGMEAEDAGVESTSIPAEVRAAGPEAVKKYKEAYGTKIAGEMAAAQSSADTMKIAEPILDRAHRAYTNLAANNAIGPMQASEVWRTTQGVVGAKNEVLRQDYEAAAKELELLKAQIQMKGQGAITEGERRILQLTLPRLDAADASTGLETLRQLKLQTRAAQQKPERIRGRGSDAAPAADEPAAAPKAPVVTPEMIRKAEEELKRRQAQGQ